MIKVSVIVPCYNAEKWLNTAMPVLCGQVLQEIEIICVDDASTDNTFNILGQWAEKDSRIKIIRHDKNKGSGVSRNDGISVARGEYIGLMDADDTVDLDFFAKLYDNAIKTDADVSVSNLDVVDVRGRHIGLKMRSMPNIMRKPEIWFSYVYTAIYKADFIRKNKIAFLDTSIMDDTYFEYVVKLTPGVKWCFCPTAFYHYLHNEDSVSRFYMPEEKIDVVVRAIGEIADLMNSSKVPEAIYIQSYLSFFRHITSSHMEKSQADSARKKIAGAILSLYDKFKRKEIIRRQFQLLFPYLQSRDIGGLIHQIDYLSHHEVITLGLGREKFVLYKIVRWIGIRRDYLFGKIPLFFYSRKIETRFEVA
ncbi:MAG: glycosyltransferase family 2 protein [Rickettsiales bacterium]|jgi:glycosyltransferase involved in cell wall biosynthesis|nr:glycosyltransferase family 2 protein [Rickettsiales bacterium]